MTEMEVGSGWTVETLRLHLEALVREADLRYQQRFAAQEKHTESALVSAQTAVNKAEAASDKRFEAVNEFRAQLSDQAASFVIRKEYEVAHRALGDRMEAMIHANSQKIEALGDTFQEKLDAIQLARNDLFSLLNDRVNGLSITQGSHSGETLGSARTLGYVISFLMVAAALGSLISYVVTH